MSDESTRNVRDPVGGLERTDVLAPTRVLADKYRLGRLLGEGGMGAVYEAEHIELGTRVAVKLLSDHYATHPTAAKRVKREARATAKIRHENIVAVTDTGTDDGTPYIVMELLEGESLSALLRRQGKLSPPVAAGVIRQVLAGTAAAHAEGVIHRDLKPGNIFVVRAEGDQARVKILDFGVSKYAADNDSTNLTATGAMLGTPLYMAPEQLRGDVDVDHRADLYAVGVILYRMVTGALPGAKIPPEERRPAILKGELPSPREVAPQVPEALERVIDKAMALEPDDRYPDAEAFRQALEEAVPDAVEALSAPPTPVRQSLPTETLQAEPRRRVSLFGAVALSTSLAILAAAFLGVWWAGDRSGERSSSPSARLGSGAAPPGPLRLGMTTYMPKAAQERIYGPIARYLGERLERPVELTILRDSEELGRKFRAGEIPIAALNPASYVEVKEDRPGIELLARPVTAGGSPTFEVYIVTKADAGFEDLEDLGGGIFCYVPSAPSGYLFPRDILRQAGFHPDSAFRTTRLVDDHVGALRHVKSGRCDATAVYASLYFQLDEYDLSPSAFQILETSERIPNDAYCAHDTLPAPTVARIREALLALEPKSRLAEEVFPGASEIVGFAPVTDEAYERVRQAVKRARADAVVEPRAVEADAGQ